MCNAVKRSQFNECSQSTCISYIPKQVCVMLSSVHNSMNVHNLGLVLVVTHMQSVCTSFSSVHNSMNVHNSNFRCYAEFNTEKSEFQYFKFDTFNECLGV